MPIKRQTIRDHSAEANLFARRTVIAGLIVIALLGMVFRNTSNFSRGAGSLVRCDLCILGS